VLNALGLTKSYGDVHALRGADLSVEEGSIVALLGKNGAGKTTLLSIISGLIHPDAGSVSLGSIDALSNPDAAAKLIGIAPQDTGIYPTLSVQQNLEFFGELAGMKKAERVPRVRQVAEQLGLAELLDRRASNLSGGEKRRLHTACALVHAPKLLLLDEPTVGADVTTRAQLIDAVKGLAADGAAVVYTTHYLPEVIELGADIVIIDNGQVLARGTRAELVETHRVEGVRFTTSEPLAADLLTSVGAVADTDGYRIASSMAVPELVQRLGPDSVKLTSVESLQPSLETVFLAVTGAQLEGESQ
jgi:ABC-2 type transport system ATP-binding protein